ncbi:MAG TPA: NAD(P)H-binding protein [Candidatus Limnocylindrales bacterium]
MKLTVFGATGRIGKHAVTQALAAGHHVTAVVRDPARLGIAAQPGLTIVTVDSLTDSAPLVAALEGRDAAISGVGPRARKDVTVASTTTHAILEAMAIAGVRRFVAVSAAPVGPVAADESWFSRRVALPLIRTLLGTIYADLARMEQQIRQSGLDWTIVRPPRLNDKPLTGSYLTRIGEGGGKLAPIGRADVAHAMLAAISNPETVRQPVGVSG